MAMAAVFQVKLLAPHLVLFKCQLICIPTLKKEAGSYRDQKSDAIQGVAV